MSLPIFGHARAKARAGACLSHIQQITQGTLLYAQDYDGNLPPARASSTTPFPYITNRSLLVCPDDRNTTGSYALNSNLKNIAYNTMAWPEKTILVYEGKAGKPDYRHGDHAALGFVDGHCKLITAPDTTSLFWTAQALPTAPPPSPALSPATAPSTNDKGTAKDPEIGGPVYQELKF